MSVLLNVRAGYIAKRDGKYVIYSTTVDKISDKLGKMNYYVLSERTIACFAQISADFEWMDFLYFGVQRVKTQHEMLELFFR